MVSKDSKHGFNGPRVDLIDKYHGLYDIEVDLIEKNHSIYDVKEANIVKFRICSLLGPRALRAPCRNLNIDIYQ